ncbi:MAG TPA: elongation factor P [Flexilinea sp.]|jgi:elongation factor P|nr:elongation factor P [Flexilinea sp.]HOP02245.1 elongation factor P [Flexilinea sp.]HOR56470.1 elongation factor P [Flexilinea sp.]HOU19857.1 elongation factor P [Flexilinea sp.]HPJ65085.1 elongation factor P [Flexilinea sp.]
MIDVNELRKGVTFEIDGELLKVLDYEHNKSGRGNASIKVKARNLRTGATYERTFTSGNRVQDVQLDFETVQFLYADSDYFHFMNTETYEQPEVRAEIMKDAAPYLKEGTEVKLTLYQNEIIDYELPMSVDLKVIQADVAVRGDTATGVSKQVTVETGARISVPNFINEGDTIRVNTSTGEYLTRV